MSTLSSIICTEDGIRRASGEYDLEQVRRLSLPLQRLNAFGPISSCTNLIHLSLRNNAFVSLEGIQSLVSLERLDLSHNALTTTLDALRPLSRLKYLDLRANLLATLDSLTPLSHISSLETLFLQSRVKEDQNPLCQLPAYSAAVFRLLPSLNMLDGMHIALISAEDEIDTLLSSIRPDLTAYPAIVPNDWLSSEMTLMTPIEEKNISGSLTPSSHRWCGAVDAIMAVEKLLKDSQQRLLESDFTLRKLTSS